MADAAENTAVAKKTRRTREQIIAAGEEPKRVKRVMFFTVKDADGYALPDAVVEIVEVIAQRDGLGKFLDLQKNNPGLRFQDVDI